MSLFFNPFNFDFWTIDWKVITGVLAFLITAFGLFYFQWWKNRKRLSYEILSDVLLASAEELQDKLEIRYEGEAVKNVRLLVIKLINDGYQPIKPEDFERSIKVSFPEARILTAEKVKVEPWNLDPVLGHRADWLEMAPALLNRKEYVQFKVLLTGSSEMRIDARIVGISAVGKARKLPLIQHSAMLWLLAALVIIQALPLGEILALPVLFLLGWAAVQPRRNK